MEALLVKLAALNIVLEAENDQLNIFDPDQNLTEELLVILKENKADLLNLFKKPSNRKEYSPIPVAPVKKHYPLSSAQKRLYFLYELNPTSTAYNITEAIRLQEDLSRERVGEIMNQLIARHESLRTYFEVMEENPVQVVLPEASIELEHFNCAESEISNVVKKFKQAFDLSQAPLIQMGYLTCDSGEEFLLVNMHHIITDQISKDILIDDFIALASGETLPPLKLHYKDYAEWQNNRVEEPDFQKQEVYWKEELSDDLPHVKLPLDFPRREKDDDKGGSVAVFLGTKEKEIIEACCEQYKLTPSMLFLAAFGLLLSKLSGQDKIIAGLSVAGRNHPDLARIMGMFVNLLPIKSFPSHHKTVSAFMEEVRQTTLLAFENQEVQFDSMVDQLGVERKLGQNAIVDVILNFITQIEAVIEAAELETMEFKHTEGTKRYDLTLNVSQFANTFLLELQYDAHLFRPETCEAFLKYLLNILYSLDNPSTKYLSDISIEREERIVAVNETLVELIQPIAQRNEAMPASYHQERLWFIDQFETDYLYDGAPIYHNIPLILDFNGNLNIDNLEKSILALLRKYPILQTQIYSQQERPFQRLAMPFDFNLKRVTAKNDSTQVKQIVAEEIAHPFEMDKSLFRALLIQQEGLNKLVITLHHSISDHYSSQLLAKELIHFYHCMEVGIALDEEEVGPAYTGFATWQQNALSQLDTYLLSYWKRQLALPLKALELPLDKPRAAVHIYESAAAEVFFSPDLLEEMATFESSFGVDRRIVLMAAFKILLYQYARHEEIVIGTSVDNRAQKGMEQLVGPVANLIVLRSWLSPEMSFVDYTKQLKEVYTEGTKHQSMPFDKLVKILAPKKDMSRTALFDVLFQFEEQQLVFPKRNDLDIDVVHTNLGYGKYDLNLFLEQRTEGVWGQLVYNRAYFDADTIERFVRHYQVLLSNLLATPQQKIEGVRMTTKAEESQLLQQLNHSNVAFPQNKTLVDFLEEQLNTQSDQVALQMGDQRLTYAELDTQSAQLAHALKKTGVGPNKIVGLLTDRSIETVVSILAILRAGGAYLPIDVDYPEERINYIIEDSGTEIVLTTKAQADKVPIAISTLLLDELDTSEENHSPLLNENKPTDLCYVIYTSGTTGHPKGVLVEHQNVVRLFFNEAFQFDFGAHDIWTMFHSHCFDFSVWEMYGALLFGGKLIIIPKSVAKDTRAFLELLSREKVSILNQTPSAFYHLIGEAIGEEKPALHLRQVIFGGEALNPSKLKAFKSLYPSTQLINMYGITETTVHVTYKEIGEEEMKSSISNIGKPIPTLSAYILDKNQRLVPQGIAGELYVGGAGVSRGYLGKEDLTNQKFVSHPYLEKEILYRSGDLARLLNSGEIEYLGRIDHQIQLRGFRIELGEIEYQLGTHPQIGEVLCLAKEEEGDKYLVTYYVAAQELDTSDLRSFLSERLPDYMIPAYFVRLSKMPLTPNGKADRAALPDPQITTGDDHVAPSNEIEEKLQAIWSEVLKLDKENISVHTSFFELGGHSLRAAVLANKILKEFQIKIPLKEFFISQTIAALSKKILSESKSTFVQIEKAPLQDYYPLSSVQRRLYFLYEFNRDSLAYNMPHVLQLSGDLDKDKLQQAFEKLIMRHESLRTSFHMIDGHAVQQVQPEVDFTIAHFSSETGSVDTSIEAFIRPFVLAEAPLLRVGLVQISEKEHVLMVDMHHIITDGFSQGILVKDFMALYKEEKRSPLKLQYKDFSVWQQSEAQQEELSKQEAFWNNEFAELPEPLNLPLDFDRPTIKNNEGAYLSFEIDQAEVLALKELAKQEETTLFMVVLAAFNVFLAKLANAEDIVVGTPVAGRPHSDLEEMIGMFVNTVILRNRIDSEETFRDFLKRLKTKTLACFENQDFPYEDLVDHLDLPRDRSRNPLFDVMFTYQNFEEERLELSGLSLSAYSFEHRVSKFDLSLVAIELFGKMHFAFEYSTALFEEETIVRFSAYFKNTISALLANKKISAVDILPAKERKTLLSQFNATAASYPKEKTIVDLFREQAAKTPENIALKFGTESMTYAMLDQVSGKIAAYLIDEQNLKTGDLVGLMLERELYMIPAIYGILKAGAAYVPIDPHFPQKRIESIIEGSGLKTLISRAAYQTEKPGLDLNIINLEESLPTILKTEPLQNDLTFSSEQLAYVIYTSGSTGKPKGVMIEHHSVINRILWMQKAYPIAEQDVLLQKTPIVFDVSVWELFWWSFTGASLVLLQPEEEKAPKEIIKTIVQNQVTTLHFVPSMLSIFLAELERGGEQAPLPSIRQVFVSGEALKSSQVKLFGQLLHQQHGSRLINLYGPTEATVDVSYYECDFAAIPNNIPIGKPIDNTQLHILDEQLQLVPTGTYGELHIAGVGLARGYLNNSALTEEKFIDHPFAPGQKLYKTGDLASWLPNGDIAFWGRLDNQVKIRGFRIELGEIETSLLRHKAISTASVLVRELKKEKELVAYYVAAAEIAVATLKAFLAEKLPEYMIPAFFVHLEAFPLTVNGKLNRRALPDPEVKKGLDFVGPVNETQRSVVKIWAEVLDLEPDVIGINKNFFDIGGNSLKLVSMVNKLNEQLNKDLSVVRVFEFPTVELLADFIGQNDDLDKTKESEELSLEEISETMSLFDNED